MSQPELMSLMAWDRIDERLVMEMVDGVRNLQWVSFLLNEMSVLIQQGCIRLIVFVTGQ